MSASLSLEHSMSKFIYVGDPTLNKKGQVNGTNREGAVTYEHPTTGAKVKFVAGVPTEAPERENRRVTLRRITPLLDQAQQ